MSLAERILQQPIELIEGVEETLEEVAQRHKLALFTKGHPDEQRMKVDPSGLGRHFSYTAIVKEKDSLAYSRLIAENAFSAAKTWMIGNSHKSDINPALEAGLGAVLVPHARTWVLEHQELRAPAGARFLRVERFADLKNHF